MVTVKKVCLKTDTKHLLKYWGTCMFKSEPLSIILPLSELEKNLNLLKLVVQNQPTL